MRAGKKPVTAFDYEGTESQRASPWSHSWLVRQPKLASLNKSLWSVIFGCVSFC